MDGQLSFSLQLSYSQQLAATTTTQYKGNKTYYSFGLNVDAVQVFVVSSFWAHNTVPFSTTFCSAIKDPAVEKRLDRMEERTIQEAMRRKLKEVDESRKGITR